jgi:hypothetical protein
VRESCMGALTKSTFHAQPQKQRKTLTMKF